MSRSTSVSQPRIHTSKFVCVWKFMRLLTFAVPFDNNNEDHKRMLQTIYRRLTASKSDPPRFGAHWERIGFQGQTTMQQNNYRMLTGSMFTMVCGSRKRSGHWPARMWHAGAAATRVSHHFSQIPESRARHVQVVAAPGASKLNNQFENNMYKDEMVFHSSRTFLLRLYQSIWQESPYKL